VSKAAPLAPSLVGHVAGGIRFAADGFESECWWIRFELQKAGAIHNNGSARLKHAPDVTDLGQAVHEGR
jgi:hypothetical protein